MNSRPVCLSCQDPSYVFVYGSNEKFVHGRGGALHAKMYHGAAFYKGPFFGNSYGISTKDRDIQDIDISRIKRHVENFIKFAKSNPDKKFFITEVGTGLANKTHEEMAMLFIDAPENCVLSDKWKSIIEKWKQNTKK